MASHTLRIDGISKSYGEKRVVNDVSISVGTEEIVGLLGPNGAGKTTTFYMTVGMIKPETGSITFDGEDITGLPMYRRARKGIGYLPQDPSIFRKLTVRQNLKAVLEIRAMRGGEEGNKSDGGFRGNGGVAHEAEKILHEFNLTECADRQSHRLSGGERRRAEIARAIALNPTFMLFDEPFTGVDPLAILELKKMLIYLKSRGLGILITDHNVRDTLSITDRAYIVSNGSVLAEGRPDDLVNDPVVKEAYLGEEFRL